jgi:hypothetical protein
MHTTRIDIKGVPAEFRSWSSCWIGLLSSVEPMHTNAVASCLALTTSSDVLESRPNAARSSRNNGKF